MAVPGTRYLAASTLVPRPRPGFTGLFVCETDIYQSSLRCGNLTNIQTIARNTVDEAFVIVNVLSGVQQYSRINIFDCSGDIGVTEPFVDSAITVVPRCRQQDRVSTDTDRDNSYLAVWMR